MKIRKTIALLLFTFAALCSFAGKNTVYYSNDFEKDPGFKRWAFGKNVILKVNYLGLSDEMAHSGKKSFKLSFSVDGGGHAYFKLPVNIRVESDKKYYVSAWMYVKEFPVNPSDRRSIGIGTNRITFFGPNFSKDTSGCNTYQSFSKPTNKWVFTESNDIGEKTRLAAVTNGMPTEKLVFDGVYLGLDGMNRGKNIVVYLDDLKIMSKPVTKKSFAVSFKKYPIVENTFPFGLYTSALSRGSQWFKEPANTPAWRIIPNWKKHYVNTISGGVQLFADSSKEKINKFNTEIKTCEDNNIKTIPMTYFSPYYKPLALDVCEKAIRTIIASHKDSNAVLAWKLIDEPAKTDSAIKQYLWAKKIYEEVDQKHPLTTGASNFGGRWEKYKTVSIFDRYPLRENQYNPWQIADVTRATYDMAHGPVWPILQAFGDINNESNGEYRMPTISEFRLMTYGALANGAKGILYYAWSARPTWTRMSSAGIVDTFEKGRGGLWKEMQRIGYQLTAIGPLLLTTDLIRKPRLKIEAGTVDTAWGMKRKVIAVGVRQDKKQKMTYLVIYSNDPKKNQTGNITLNSSMLRGKKLYNLYSLKEVPLKNNSFTISLDPGDGKIYLLASPKKYSLAKQKIFKNRFNTRKEIIKYDVYLALLSKLVPESMVSEFNKADNMKKLDALKSKLKKAMAQDKFVKIKKKLSAVQNKLSAINALIEQKITSQESLEPKGIQSRFIKREFNPADPLVRAYMDATIELGSWYFCLQTMFHMGRYSDIGYDTARLDRLTTKLYEQLEQCFVKNKKVEKLELPIRDLSRMRDKFNRYQEEIKGKRPNPSQVGLK